MDPNVHAMILLVLGILAGGPAVNVVAQLIKKSFAKFHIDSDTVIHTMVIAVTAVAAAAQYIGIFKDYFPWEVIGVSGPAIYGISQLVFKYAKYTDNYLGRLYVAQHTAAQVNTPSTFPAQISDSIPAPAQNTNSFPL